MARTKATARIVRTADVAAAEAVAREARQRALAAPRRVRPRRSTSKAHRRREVPVTTGDPDYDVVAPVDPLATEGVVLPRVGPTTGPSGATAVEAPTGPNTDAAGPSGVRYRHSRVPAIGKWVTHGWWLTTRAPFVGWQWCDAILNITFDPINNVTLFSGVGVEYGAVQAIACPRRTGAGDFYITAQVEGSPPWRYLVNRANMMAPVPQAIIDRIPAIHGLGTAVQWWQGYESTVQEERQRVTLVCSQMTTEQVKRIKQYMHRRGIAAQAMEAGTAGGSAGASTSSAPPAPIPEVVANPGVDDPDYRAYAFPVNAPPGGPRRPLGVRRETVLPSDREGRRGRAYAAALAAQGPPMELSGDEMELPPAGPRREVAEVQAGDMNMVRLPRETELDEGYVWGREVLVNVPVAYIRIPEDPLTNHRVMNAEHARSIYDRLASETHMDVSYMTLRPISYKNESEGVEGLPAAEIRFDVEGGATTFKDVMDAWKVAGGYDEHNWRDHVREILRHVTWEPVDGQHILLACKEIATAENEDVEAFGEDAYTARFVHRACHIVVYDDPTFYVHESRRLNAHHCARRKYATVGENLQKMRDLWDRYGRPGADQSQVAERAAFMACLPTVVSTRIVPSQGEVSVRTIRKAFQDWLPHVEHERDEEWEAVRAVCRDYDDGRTHYSPGDLERWQEYERKVAQAPNTKKPARKDMAIGWLRPLKGLAPGEYRLICRRASVSLGSTRQGVFFQGYNAGKPGARTSLAENAKRLKQRYAVRNALRYLSIRALLTQFSWEQFLTYPLTDTLSNDRTVAFFGRQCSHEFVTRWCIPKGKVPAHMKAWETLIPAVIIKHYNAVTAGGRGFEGSTWRGAQPQLWRWMRTVAQEGRGQRIIQGHGSIFSGEHVQLQQSACWIFDCRQGGSANPRSPWTQADFSAVIGHVMTWMGGMPRWNALFLLSPGETFERIWPLLALPEGAIKMRAVWVFRDHAQAKGRHMKYEGQVVGSYDPYADVVAVAYKPKGANPAPNFVCTNGLFSNPTCFVEPEQQWGAPPCDRRARSPELVDRILKSYLPSGWALVVQGLSAIVPQLGESTARRIVVLEADPDRETYVKQWASSERVARRAPEGGRRSEGEAESEEEEEASEEDLEEEGGDDLDGGSAEEGDEDEDEEEEGGDDSDADGTDESDGDDSEEDDSSEDDEEGGGGENVSDEEAREEDASPERRGGGDSEVESPLKMRRSSSGRGLLVRSVDRDRGARAGKGKGSMEAVRQSLSGGRGRVGAGLVRRSMPAGAAVPPSSPVAITGVAAEVIGTKKTLHVPNPTPPARKRLVLRHRPGSPVAEPSTAEGAGRQAESLVPVGSPNRVSTDAQVSTTGPPLRREAEGVVEAAPTSTSPMQDDVVMAARLPMGQAQSDPYSVGRAVPIPAGALPESTHGEYTMDVDGMWRDATDTRYRRIEPAVAGEEPYYVEAGILEAELRNVDRIIWSLDPGPLDAPMDISNVPPRVEDGNPGPSSRPEPDATRTGQMVAPRPDPFSLHLNLDAGPVADITGTEENTAWYRDAETMESDPGWNQGVGPVDHVVEGDYYVARNGNAYALESWPEAHTRERDLEKWGSQAGRVYVPLSVEEVAQRRIAHQAQHNI